MADEVKPPSPSPAVLGQPILDLSASGNTANSHSDNEDRSAGNGGAGLEMHPADHSDVYSKETNEATSTRIVEVQRNRAEKEPSIVSDAGIGDLKAAKDPPEQSPAKKRWASFRHFLDKYWLLFGLGVAIGLAAAFPDLARKNGILRTDIWIKYVATSIVFILTGLTLKSQVLLSAITLWKLHLFTLAISLGLVPLVGWGIGTALLLTPINPALASGLIIATCCPTTVSSNVIMTKQAGGNDAAAVVGAVLGNVIGIFVSPMLILAMVHVSAPPPYSKLFFDLSLTVLIPLLVGQLLRFFFPSFPVRLQKHFNIGIFNNCMILLMVWSTFSDTFAAHLSMAAWEIVVIVLLCAALYLFFSGSILFGSYSLRRPLRPFERRDAIAVMFVGATKTIALGIPLVSIIYEKDPMGGLVAAPLLIYHAVQLLVGAVIVPSVGKWMERGEVVDADGLERGAGLVKLEEGGQKDIESDEITVVQQSTR